MGRKKYYFDDSTCKIRLCDEKPIARGFCRKHYMQFYRNKKVSQLWYAENIERQRNRWYGYEMPLGF